MLPFVLGGGALLYVLSLGVFALVHYDGPRPGVGRVMRDFHAALGIGPSPARASPQPVEAPLPPPPPPRVAPPPPRVRAPSKLDRIDRVLDGVAKRAPSLRRLDRGPAFDEARLRLLNELCDARDELNAILDEDPGDDRANGLWDRLQYLLAALRKL